MARIGGSPCPRVCDPDVALVVHVDTVRPRDQPGAEAADEVAFPVVKQHRVDAGSHATVRAATLGDPDVAVERDLDGARRAPLAAIGQLTPPVQGPERVRRHRLGDELRARRHHGGGHDSESETNPIQAPHRALLHAGIRQIRGPYDAGGGGARMGTRRLTDHPQPVATIRASQTRAILSGDNEPTYAPRRLCSTVWT